jgi:general secretion pathway protein F
VPGRDNLGGRSAARDDRSVGQVPNFRYRALTATGEIVSGSLSAATLADVTSRIEYLGLIPIETISDGAVERRPLKLSLGGSLRPEHVTVFTRDLSLLLKAGARLDEALELLSTDSDTARMGPVISGIRAAVLSGESFADALARHARVFPPMYVALVRVGEASGTLDHILEVLAAERARDEELRRKLSDALRYPAFLLLGAIAVLIFFLMFVLPQFASVLRDFGAKLDPVVTIFLSLSDVLRNNTDAIGAIVICGIAGAWPVLRRPTVRARMMDAISRLPLMRHIVAFHRTALFCRNLGILLDGGVALTTALRILVDMMAGGGNAAAWTKAVERVRQGGKLSDALVETAVLPAMAIRMLRLGEETGQLPMIAARIAEFYQAKQQRSVDRLVGIAGPVAIVGISIVVGGLIVSVMTSLLSVSQIVG